jgi:hypothetical protein
VLLREDERGLLAIGQPSHAWLSGQLARAWGNERFGALEPREQVCVAAEQHDVGWAERDLEPLYNPDTERPRSFMEMPVGLHLGLFTAGPRSLLSQSRYAALLVSMHGSRLYRRRDLSRVPRSEADAIRAFLADQLEFQNELIATLDAEPDAIERNSLLVWTWDYLSLALCLDWAPATAKGCPTAEGTVDLELTGAGDRVHVDPWPFSEPELTVRCEGRRLPGRFADEDALRVAFAAAPWETLEFELAPAPASSSSPSPAPRHQRGP